MVKIASAKALYPSWALPWTSLTLLNNLLFKIISKAPAPGITH